MSQIQLTEHVFSHYADFPSADSFMSANPLSENGSIESFIIDNSANFSVQEYVHKLSTTQLLSDPKTASDPEVLLEVQKSILDYGLQTSLESALTRKAISAVEGLLRG